MSVYVSSVSTGTPTTFTNCTIINTSNTATGTGAGTLSAIPVDSDITVYRDDNKEVSGEAKVLSNSELTLPDGSVINVDNDGNFNIEDKDSKVIYKANRIREFNRYMNASDLLEEFIEDLGKANVRQGEVLKIPIEMFINWVIHKSAEQDGDKAPKDVPSLEDNRYKHPRCKCCGRFIKKSNVSKGLYFCNGNHYDKYLKGK